MACNSCVGRSRVERRRREQRTDVKGDIEFIAAGIVYRSSCFLLLNDTISHYSSVETLDPVARDTAPSDGGTRRILAAHRTPGTAHKPHRRTHPILKLTRSALQRTKCSQFAPVGSFIRSNAQRARNMQHGSSPPHPLCGLRRHVCVITRLSLCLVSSQHMHISSTPAPAQSPSVYLSLARYTVMSASASSSPPIARANSTHGSTHAHVCRASLRFS